MTDANATLIKMEGVKKVFYTDEVETHALSEIHLEIKKGQYISIAGPSGCGKSTLLSILGLLDSPTGGGDTLNGQPVANLSISERTRIRNPEIGFIFQAFNLIERFATGCPLSVYPPPVGESRRPRMESNVDLPQPEGPAIEMYCPFLISRWISDRACVSTSSV